MSLSAVQPDAGNFFFMLLVAGLSDIMFSCIFRFLGFLLPNGFVAQQIGAPMVSQTCCFL